jgi:hypothetical protein
MPEAEMPTLDEVHAFLLGTGPINGVWFGDQEQGSGRPYWWRKFLREAIAARPTDPGEDKVEAVALIGRLSDCLRELVAVVRGECPSLLNEDSGGDAKLDIEIDEALEDARAAIAAMGHTPPSGEDGEPTERGSPAP